MINVDIERASTTQNFHQKLHQRNELIPVSYLLCKPLKNLRILAELALQFQECLCLNFAVSH